MKWTSGFNIGIVSGVIVGLLFAPTSGAETRQCVKGKLDLAKENFYRWRERRQNQTLKELKETLIDEDAELTPKMRRQLLNLLKSNEWTTETIDDIDL